jgi:glycosyltransferase involved in cell wall biosynthesis
VAVARLTHEKGLERAIAAVAQARAQGTPLTVHLVGDGPLRDTLQQQAADSGVTDYVIFHGSQINPYPYIRQADVLVVPSHHEAAPMVIDEAVSLGIPVLTTATTSAKEMVPDRGAGWVCTNTDEAFVHALCRIAADPASLRSVSRCTSPATNEAALIGWDTLMRF